MGNTGPSVFSSNLVGQHGVGVDPDALAHAERVMEQAARRVNAPEGGGDVDAMAPSPPPVAVTTAIAHLHDNPPAVTKVCLSTVS